MNGDITLEQWNKITWHSRYAFVSGEVSYGNVPTVRACSNIESEIESGLYELLDDVLDFNNNKEFFYIFDLYALHEDDMPQTTDDWWTIKQIRSEKYKDDSYGEENLVEVINRL